MAFKPRTEPGELEQVLRNERIIGWNNHISEAITGTVTGKPDIYYAGPTAGYATFSIVDEQNKRTRIAAKIPAGTSADEQNRYYRQLSAIEGDIVTVAGKNNGQSFEAYRTARGEHSVDAMRKVPESTLRLGEVDEVDTGRAQAQGAQYHMAMNQGRSL